VLLDDQPARTDDARRPRVSTPPPWRRARVGSGRRTRCSSRWRRRRSPTGDRHVVTVDGASPGPWSSPWMTP